MFKNYLKVAIKNIINHKIYSFINLFGLVIGIVCFLLVMLTVKYELSFDRHIKKSDRIYRIIARAKLGETRINTNNTPGFIPIDLKRNYKEVEQYARLALQYNSAINIGETVMNEPEVAGADKNIFDIFEMSFIYGDPNTALSGPGSLVISEKTANKYFGSKNPLGKVVQLNKKQDLKITGVFKDFPENSHIGLTLFVSISTFDNNPAYDYLTQFNCISYILFKENFNPEGILYPYNERIKKQLGYKSNGGLLSEGDELDLQFQKLTDIHLYSNLKDELKSNGNINQIYIFSTIAFFILLIACINFINLSTAKSMLRAKEVAIRKTVGSDKIQIIKQFLGESILISFIALIISLVIIELILPAFRNFTHKQMALNYFENIWLIPSLIFLIAFIGIVSGLYPAFFLSSFEPVKILKGKNKQGLRGSGLRNKLVIFQFSITIIFFINTIIVYNQLDFLKNKNLGFDRENVIVLYTPISYHKKINLLREKLLQNASVLSVTNSHSVPGSGADFTEVIYEPQGRESLMLKTSECDYNYLKTFNVNIIQGRFFSKEYVSDPNSSIVINESAAKFLGWQDPIGKTLIWWNDKKYTVIGVMNDFNFESLHKNIKPMALVLNTENPHWAQRFISVRIANGDYNRTIESIKKIYKEVESDIPFRYSFLDDRYNKLYNDEFETGKLYTIFSILAIIVACLGLLGLVTFATEQRTKEIAIRKIIGAKLTEILLLLSRDSLKWVFFANVIAWPVSFYLMNKWLENFAYRINPGIFEFIIAGLLAAFIAFITVLFQLVKVARSNPVESLKYE